jgi:hypothetical protein
MKKKSDPESGSISYGSEDPDPHQNVTDPQHCLSPCQQHSKKSWVGLIKVMVHAVLHKF